MDYTVKSGQPEKQRTPLLVLFQHNKKTLSFDLPHPPFEKLMAVKLEENIPLSERQFQKVAQNLILALSKTSLKEATLCLDTLPVNMRDNHWKIRQFIEICHHTCYRFDNFKSQKQNPATLQHLHFLVSNKNEVKGCEKAIQEGVAITAGMHLAKDLANLPANVCTPSFLANEAKAFAKAHPNTRVTVLDHKQIKALGMGLFLSVANGAKSSPQLITLAYQGGAKSQQPIVFVGKGITFDTGGNSLKSGTNMIGMKYDMCGAAAVLGVLKAVSTLSLPLNIVGVIPACENMPGPTATRPEDIVKSLSGLHVEILNTDAEGRLVLADALTYCEKFKPECVIDIATLTGAVSMALGPYASGLMSEDEKLLAQLQTASHQSSDKVWPLPLWEEYHEALESEFADFSNIPYKEIGGKTIIAGCFLSKFAKHFSWAHLDVANTAFGINFSRGATGKPIPLLTQFLINKISQQ